ncbi:hypothetical protein C8R43DRAFT_1126977 [Mycena crocata]|nr:hypothetical protein C8R43DRAFT_1126977 [Mycena crocata]
MELVVALPNLTSVTAQEKLSVVLDDVPTFAPPVGHPIYSAHYGVLEDMAGTLVGFFTCTPPSRGVFSFLPGSSTFLVTFRAGKASVAPSSTTATRELGEPLGTFCDFIPRKYSAGDQMDTVVVCPREHYGLLERLFTSQVIQWRWDRCKRICGRRLPKENIRYIMVCLTLFRWTSNDSAHCGVPEKYLDPTFHLHSTSSQRFFVSAGFLYIFGRFPENNSRTAMVKTTMKWAGVGGGQAFASCTHAIRDLVKLSLTALVDRCDACPRKHFGPPIVSYSVSVAFPTVGPCELYSCRSRLPIREAQFHGAGPPMKSGAHSSRESGALVYYVTSRAIHVNPSWRQAASYRLSLFIVWFVLYWTTSSALSGTSFPPHWVIHFVLDRVMNAFDTNSTFLLTGGLLGILWCVRGRTCALVTFSSSVIDPISLSSSRPECPCDEACSDEGPAEDGDGGGGQARRMLHTHGFRVGVQGGVGVAAVSWASGGESYRTKHLEDECDHTVFESEVVGAILALDIIMGTPRLTDVDVFTDCQPALLALATPNRQPGQYLLAAFQSLHRLLLCARLTSKIRFHWVPVNSMSPETRLKTRAPRKLPPRLNNGPHSPRPSGPMAAGVKELKDRWLAVVPVPLIPPIRCLRRPLPLQRDCPLLRRPEPV